MSFSALGRHPVNTETDACIVCPGPTLRPLGHSPTEPVVAEPWSPEQVVQA
ncbi:MAG: hypothetical protein J07HX5_01912, partial [halophilic archaeon J07HX5]